MALERVFTLRPAYRSPESRGSATAVFLVKGSVGVVQFVLYTGWYRTDDRVDSARALTPMPADLGYHAVAPRYEGQTPQKECPYFGTCYYDGSGLNAERPFTLLVNEGSDALWAFLEAYYRALFKEGEWPL